MKSILIPTDFSEISRDAILHTLSLFRTERKEIRLTLLNAYLVPNVDSENAVLINDQLKEKVNKRLLSERDKITELTKDYKIHFEAFAYMGSVENVIPEILKKQKFDLVVMGKNGGQFIEKVSRALRENNSKCPLLTVYPPSNPSIK
jgi:nucleotide-binding universal stress UspA family protein